MRLEGATVVLRERSLAEVLELTLRWTVAVCGRVFLRLGLLVLLPCLALCAWARWGAGWPWGLVWLLALALATLAQGAFTVAAGALVFDARATARGALWTFTRRLPAYLRALALSRVALLAGLLLGGLGLLFVWPRVALVHEATLLEGVRRPLSRARQMGRAVQSRVLGLSVLQILRLGAGALLAHALLSGLLEDLLQLPLPLGRLEEGGSLFALLGFFGALPFAAAARVLLYMDVRTRQDAWDLQVGLQRVAHLQAQDAEAPA